MASTVGAAVGEQIVCTANPRSKKVCVLKLTEKIFQHIENIRLVENSVVFDPLYISCQLF